ncbi:histidine kinase [Tsukamurella sp. 8F]|uniref:sensor histidine kinase n=1 Tax=Tsukamurella sp. 8F TaxID=3031961 RepID=UPI0023B8C491|nr:histidine kinase [Tsukamurella sp. 8F]MDF0586093.1 histidine kinase [Tsukamurella sp. 8F]
MKMVHLAKDAHRVGRYLEARADAPGSALHQTLLGAYLARKSNWLFLVAALILFAVAWPTLPFQLQVSAALLPIVSGLSVLPVALAWQEPRIGWGVSAATAAVVSVVFDPMPDWHWHLQVPHIIVLLVLTFFMYVRRPVAEALGAWAATCMLFYWCAEPGTGGGWVAGLSAMLVVSMLLRLVLASRSRLAEQEEVTDLERARRAVLEERTRIARDLHDIVAHRMSLVVVQAQTARYRVPGLAPAALAEFDGIATSAREALGEVRSLLGVLRLEDQRAEHAPAPGLEAIDDMIEGTRAAGISVDYLPVPGGAHVAEATALAAYRIVQESIANATRHAQGSAITVALTTDGDQLNVRIENGPAVSTADLGGPGLGHGIPGMVERAHAAGGSLVATPRPDGGFAVRAVLPVAGPAH